jgi:cytochrome c biogenesis protein CcdA
MIKSFLVLFFKKGTASFLSPCAPPATPPSTTVLPHRRIVDLCPVTCQKFLNLFGQGMG